jgi:curli biogenesis system outer membrane secretion channel CsgG
MQRQHSHALAQSERFNKHDREVIDKIKTEVEMADLTLLQLLAPKEKYNPPT